MPLDPEFLAETNAWLTKAQRDLRAAELVATEPALRGDSLFHCQQAAEKSLKAFLTWHSRTFPKTHSIGDLGHDVASILPALEPLLREAAELTDYAWKYRYPGDVEEPTESEVSAAIGLAHRVYDAIVAELPNEACP